MRTMFVCMTQSKYLLPTNWIQYLLTYILLTINVGWIAIAIFNQEIAIRLVVEDGVIQWLQFCFLLLTSLYCLRIVLSNNESYGDRIVRNCFIFFFICGLAVAFEEISWGQRIFDIKTPEIIKEINDQNEITLHNLCFFQRFRHWLLILFGLAGLSLIYIKAGASKIQNLLLPFSPPSFFKTAYVLILISAIFLEISCLLKLLIPGPLTKELRFWAGRYSEIGELGVAVTAFAYAAQKSKELINDSKE